MQGLVVISAGFAEIGPDGQARERRRCRARPPPRHAFDRAQLDGGDQHQPRRAPGGDVPRLAPAAPAASGSRRSRGRWARPCWRTLRRLGLGVSTFVAVGNRPDVSGNDLVAVLGDRPRHRLGVAVPRELRQPPELRPHLPAAVSDQAGRGREERAGHDPPSRRRGVIGRCDWPAEASIDAMLRQTGVIRVDTLEQLFDVARVLVPSTGARRQPRGGDRQFMGAGRAGDRRLPPGPAWSWPSCRPAPRPTAASARAPWLMAATIDPEPARPRLQRWTR